MYFMVSSCNIILFKGFWWGAETIEIIIYYIQYYTE